MKKGSLFQYICSIFQYIGKNCFSYIKLILSLVVLQMIMMFISLSNLFIYKGSMKWKYGVIARLMKSNWLHLNHHKRVIGNINWIIFSIYKAITGLANTSYNIIQMLTLYSIALRDTHCSRFCNYFHLVLEISLSLHCTELMKLSSFHRIYWKYNTIHFKRKKQLKT